jgi:hypothetical protein
MAFYTRNQWCGFIDISETSTPTWARVRLSEKLELDEGTKTESYNFVDSDSETTTITGFAPKFELEQFAEANDTLYAYLNKAQHEMDATKRETSFLFCRPGSEHFAELYPVMLTDIKVNAPDQKIEYTLASRGKATIGTWSITDNTPTFTPASASTNTSGGSTSGNGTTEGN